LNDSDDKEKFLREQGLAFYGKITASLSHELNNAVAIINEYNGLLNDMVDALKQGIPLDDKKLQRSTKKIGLQIERGQGLVKRLNRFAHSSDSFNTSTNINELLELITSLSQRLVGLKGMDLELMIPEEIISLRTNPYYFQLAVFTCIEIFMANPDDNRHIKIEALKEGDNSIVKIIGSNIEKSDFISQKESLLKLLLEQFNCSYDIELDDDSGQSIRITLRELKPEIS